MGKIVALLGAVVIVTFLSSQEVGACSCQPMHPQDLFCRSDFVIKALVNKGRLVELREDGTFRRLHKNGKDEEEEEDTESSGFFEEPTEVGPERVAFPLIEEVEGDQPAPLMIHPRGPRGPNSRMPGYNPGPSGLRRRSRPVVHPPGYESGHVRHRRKAPRSSRIRRRRFPGASPGRLSELPHVPMKRLMMQYRINIIKIFKGLENFTKTQLDFVYTPPPPLCNVDLPADHSPFILMGNVLDGSLQANLCDYRVELKKLTLEERSNVVRNMEHRYPKECGRCSVRVCLRGDCDTEAPFTCTWKEWWSAGSPWSSQFACIHGKNGQCKWYYPLPEDVKPEDVDNRSH